MKKRRAPESDEEVEPVSKKRKEKESKEEKHKKHKKRKSDSERKDKDKKRDKKDKKDKKSQGDSEKRKDKKKKKEKNPKRADPESSEESNSSIEQESTSMKAKTKLESELEEAKDMEVDSSAYGHDAMDPAVRQLGETMSTENRVAGDMLSAVKARRNLLWGPKPQATQMAPTSTAPGRNDWNQSKFSSASDKEKFMRLMGAKGVKAGESDVGKNESQETMFSQLESQYAQGIQIKKSTYSNKRKGL